MFTGIVEGAGRVKRLARKSADAQLEIETDISLADVAPGDSIAINGVCLTITAKTDKTFIADVSAETLARTTLPLLTTGALVNLEKSIRAGGFFGGHFVLGHVDAACRILAKTQKAGSLIMAIAIDESLARYIVAKGSIAIDGISLTVNKLEKDRFYVNIISHTAAETTLAGKNMSDLVNVETDILGKYVEKLLQTPRGIDKNFLALHGFIK